MQNVPCLLMMIADVLSAVGGVASVIAACAALVTVVYARATVAQARAARQESKDAHTEETRQQTQLLAAIREAHQQEMAERERALESALVLQRLTQLGRITELLGEVADLGRAEINNPHPAPWTQWSQIPGGLACLEAAIVIYERLGGPPLSEARQMSIDCRMQNTPPERVVGEAMSVLTRITFLAKDNNGLAPPHSTTIEPERT
jgi:hypothetical protein